MCEFRFLKRIEFVNANVSTFDVFARILNRFVIFLRFAIFVDVLTFDVFTRTLNNFRFATFLRFAIYFMKKYKISIFYLIFENMRSKITKNLLRNSLLLSIHNLTTICCCFFNWNLKLWTMYQTCLIVVIVSIFVFSMFNANFNAFFVVCLNDRS